MWFRFFSCVHNAEPCVSSRAPPPCSLARADNHPCAVLPSNIYSWMQANEREQKREREREIHNKLVICFLVDA